MIQCGQNTKSKIITKYNNHLNNFISKETKNIRRKEDEEIRPILQKIEIGGFGI